MTIEEAISAATINGAYALDAPKKWVPWNPASPPIC